MRPADGNQQGLVSDPEQLQALASRAEWKEFIYGGYTFRCTESVLSPRFSGSGRFITKYMDVGAQHYVLDMGTGSGIIAIGAAQRGARVLACDIVPDAVAVARENVAHANLSSRVTVLQSDLFSAIPSGSKFDRIIFNSPFWDRTPTDESPLTFALYDRGYETLERFLAAAHYHLSPAGRVLLGFSDRDRPRKCEELTQRHDWIIEAQLRETAGHTRVLSWLKHRSQVNSGKGERHPS